MYDTDKFVGIPHQFNQDSFESCDCLGLCRLFYKDHHWEQDFKDGQPITKDWQEKNGSSRLFKYFKKHFKETRDVDSLTYGDIALFKINGAYHFGIYIEDGKILAMEVPVQYGISQSTLYRSRFWKPYFVRGFKR